MLSVLPPCNANVVHLADGNILYYYYQLPKTIVSFETMLDLSLWRTFYKPFSCIILNQKTQEILLVRDHLGIAPLYYCLVSGKKLIVNETIPDILKQLPSVPPLLENQILTLFSEHKDYSDETLYQGIFRVEPGHLMHFKADGSVCKKAFWQLERYGDLLYYEHDQDYLDHFTMLMNEAMINATEDHQNIAAEFSAGLDSSAVYCAAANICVKPELFMHIATPGTDSAQAYNDCYEKAFIEHYQITGIKRIGAEGFNPIQIFKDYAQWFAGPAPYLFFMFAHNLHKEVAARHHPILLSGFGGDQGVSGQIPLNFYVPELLRQKKFRQAWLEIAGKKARSYSPLHQLVHGLNYLKYVHPHLYELSLKIKNIKIALKNNLLSGRLQISSLTHPYHRKYYNSVREAEWFLLQGPLSYEVRMRIEYSSIITKKMGFEYRYPLLYPKLLEFILSVPLKQKRRNGLGRYLLRQYLSQFSPKMLFNTYQKKEGLGIVPSTFDLYKQKFKRGEYEQDFKDLPYSNLIHHPQESIVLRNCIKGFMLQEILLYGHAL